MKTKILNQFRTVFQLPFAEKWIRNQVRDKRSTSLIGRMVPNNHQYPKGSIRAFDYKGIQLELDIHDYVSHYLYFQFKDDSHETLMGLVAEGATILDIGTNYGTTILQFAQRTGKNGNCYGFEPDPVNYEICTKNIALNSFLNVQVENVGLGNEKGRFTLVVDTASNRGGNRILETSEGKENHIVDVIVLDEWVKNKAIEKIDLVKIDVEGFEMNVLKGGYETIKKYHPVLFIELDDDNLKQQNSSAQELISLLEELDYSVFHSETREKILSSRNFAGTHFDIIAKYE